MRRVVGEQLLRKFNVTVSKQNEHSEKDAFHVSRSSSEQSCFSRMLKKTRKIFLNQLIRERKRGGLIG